MKFELPPLPYAKDALEPHISSRTVTVHYEKHHRGYLDKLKDAVDEPPASLEELIKSASGSTFNFAAQVWNHNFYWQSMTPKGGGTPSDGELNRAIERSFGSLDDLKRELAEAAADEFGSGWAWLIAEPDSGRLAVVSTTDAENPLQSGQVPLLTIDVWEHAYYLDYQNERGRYIAGFLDHLVDWSFAADRYRQSRRER